MPIRTPARRATILRVAGRIFLQEGYAVTTIDRIIAELGGSKATLYGYFPSKAALFAAYVEEVGAPACAALAAVEVEGREPEAVLQDIARAYLDLTLAPSVLAVTRLVMAETVRFPELGRVFFENGLRRTERQIAAILQRVAERGGAPGWDRLASPSAAAHFRALCEAGPREGCIWGLRETVPQEEVERTARQAVVLFLHGWLNPGEPPPTARLGDPTRGISMDTWNG